jgi:ABC-type phosphate transport system substrate-binding protein
MMRTALRHTHIAVGLIVLGGLAGAPAAADVVAVVSAKSSVTTLSKSQVADIFLGKTARFPDGSQAVPIDQSEGTSVRDEFYSKVAGKTAAQIKAHWSKIIFTGRGQPPQSAAGSSETKKRVAANPHIIGYIEPDLLDESVRVVTLTQ